MRAPLPLVLPLLLVLGPLAGCGGVAAIPPGVPGEAPPPGETGADVRIDGVSVVGAWRAVAVQGDAEATRDLESGTLQTTLTIAPGGGATLTGVDRRAGGEPVTLRGRVEGRRLAFEGRPSSGILRVEGRRLLLEDPFGRTTVYARVSG